MEADQLIAEIARTTGLRLDKADPILAAAAINEILLDRALVKLDRQVKVQADRVTAASTQAVLDAKREAEALLTEAGEWIEGKNQGGWRDCRRNDAGGASPGKASRTEGKARVRSRCLGHGSHRFDGSLGAWRRCCG